MRFLFSSALVISAAAAIPSPAFATDWRTCTVGACLMGPCAADEGLIIVSRAIDVDNAAIGGATAAAEGMKQYLLRQTKGQVSGGMLARCSDPQPSEGAAQTMANHVHEVMSAQYAHGYVTMEYANTVFPGYDAAMASASGASPAGNEAASKAKPVKVAEKSEKAPPAPPKGGGGDPMNFLMWVDLREPINGVNSLCFHAIKTKPAPEGYRGSWPTLKNALPIIKSYFPAMIEECSKHGTPVSANVGFATDDVSPAEKRKTMQADVERWRKQGFPEVYISN